MDILLLFKKRNFTILREFEYTDGVFVKEYVYNSKRFLTDVWPPKILLDGFVPPIQSAVRDDGTDVTETMIRFSGPMRNSVNPLGAYTKRKRLRLGFVGLFGIRLSTEDYWEPYEGTVTLTNAYGIKKVTPISINGGGASSLPS